MIRHGMVRSPALLALLVLGAIGPEAAPAPARKTGERPAPAPRPRATPDREDGENGAGGP